ncbi:MAG: glycerol kinase [Pseudomonadota bacterium]|jgi:glycerol kinase
MSRHILAIDQGTTSSRAVVFDDRGQSLGSGQAEFPQLFPANGWVEHDPEAIWQTTLDSCRGALQVAGLNATQITTIGITNQRETTLLWERATGKPLHNAIVWQDRRTADFCDELKRQGKESLVAARTGLLLDPYFSASKLRWLLHSVPGAMARARAGELAFGTVDTFLLWRLTGGRCHATDATNASRTALFNIHAQQWDPELLELFDIPAAVLPTVQDCAADFGHTDPALLGAAIPIQGMAGDQQAAAFGQCCFEPGMAKSTYGTGCFLLMNTGRQALSSANRLLTTVAYRLNGNTNYAVEGSIFMAGATMQWLRDGLQLIRSAADSSALAQQAGDSLSVYLVPAFTGLGAPYWDAQARGAIFGLTRDTGIKELVTAGLLSVCYQTRDLTEAIAADGTPLKSLRVDGGMVANDFLLQALADILGCRVDRPRIIETTALGAAYLAGLQAGIFPSLSAITELWQLDQAFSPKHDDDWRRRYYAGWQDAVRRTLSDFPCND